MDAQGRFATPSCQAILARGCDGLECGGHGREFRSHQLQA